PEKISILVMKPDFLSISQKNTDYNGKSQDKSPTFPIITRISEEFKDYFQKLADVRLDCHFRSSHPACSFKRCPHHIGKSGLPFLSRQTFTGRKRIRNRADSQRLFTTVSSRQIECRRFHFNRQTSHLCPCAG